MKMERKKHCHSKGKSLRWTWGVLFAAFLIVHVSFLISSCTSIDCPVQNNIYTTYHLKKADGTPDTLTYDTLWVWTARADGKDTLLINRLCGTKASKFDLPISNLMPEDEFYLALVDTMGYVWLDTIRIQKENGPRFESVDCQAVFFHEITGVSSTHHAIDTVVINNPHVNYDTSTEHFHLFLEADR